MAGRVFANKMNIGNVRTVTAAGAITMVNEGVLLVNKTVGAASAVTMQSDPAIGDFVFIKDAKGDGAANPITITPAQSKTIDGAATYVINQNYGSVLLTWNGTEWNQVGGANQNAAAVTVTNGTFTALTATTASIGALKLTDTGTLAATGTVIANAAPVVNSVTTVTGANDAKGVVLPATSGGKAILLYSDQATNGLLVYPQVNSTINGGSANAAITIEGKSAALFIPTNASNWAALFVANA